MYFSWKQWFEIKIEGFLSFKNTVSLHKILIDELELCIILVDYFDVFISCSNSDGTHSLQKIHW